MNEKGKQKRKGSTDPMYGEGDVYCKLKERIAEAKTSRKVQSGHGSEPCEDKEKEH